MFILYWLDLAFVVFLHDPKKCDCL